MFPPTPTPCSSNHSGSLLYTSVMWTWLPGCSLSDFISWARLSIIFLKITSSLLPYLFRVLFPNFLYLVSLTQLELRVPNGFPTKPLWLRLACRLPVSIAMKSNWSHSVPRQGMVCGYPYAKRMWFSHLCIPWGLFPTRHQLKVVRQMHFCHYQLCLSPALSWKLQSWFLLEIDFPETIL